MGNVEYHPSDKWVKKKGILFRAEEEFQDILLRDKTNFTKHFDKPCLLLKHIFLQFYIQTSKYFTKKNLPLMCNIKELFTVKVIKPRKGESEEGVEWVAIAKKN